MVKIRRLNVRPDVSVQKSVAYNEARHLIQRKWRMLERVQWVTDNMHKQVAADLCRFSGATILLPAMPEGEMVEKIDDVT